MSVANTFEMQMLALINQDRAALGIAPLTFNGKLNDAAEQHSQWMLANDVFSHTGANGSSSHDRMQAAGFQFTGAWTSGENISWQSERGSPGIRDDVADMHRSLMNSPGHRANLLNPDFKEIGIGIEQGQFTTGGTTWNAVNVTQNFARSSANNGGSGAPSASRLIGDRDANRLTGTEDAEFIDGREGNDLLFGKGGADRLQGGMGNDRLYGGGGNDQLQGGSGQDFLTGGSGADNFAFAPGFGQDRITDFADNLDNLVFSRSLADQAMSASQFARSFARATAEGVVFDFGDGQRLTIDGVASVAQLYDDILFVA